MLNFSTLNLIIITKLLPKEKEVPEERKSYFTRRTE